MEFLPTSKSELISVRNNFKTNDFSSESDNDSDCEIEVEPKKHSTPPEYLFLNRCRTENKSEVNVFSPMLGSFNISDSSDDKKKLFSMLNKNYKENKTEHFAE